MDLLTPSVKLAGLAEAEARRLRRKMVFCVIDLHGNIVLKHRMTGSILIGLEMAERKAYAAAALQMKTADMAAHALPGEPFHIVMVGAGDKYWIDGGGVPFRIKGEIVAGFGVSGGTVDEDVAVAEAAIGAFNQSELGEKS
jgi:uncharacterized protein GlcG (DUF336 family)